MLNVSANFSAKRRSGVFGFSPRVELYLPKAIASAAAASETNYPVTAIYDGDRTHLNAGAAGSPENYTGGGEWRAPTMFRFGIAQAAADWNGGTQSYIQTVDNAIEAALGTGVTPPSNNLVVIIL